MTDTSLDFLARRLRILGYDVVTAHGAALEELFETARVEQRTVLTLSRRHPRRFADVPSTVIPRGDPKQALRELAMRYSPATAPFTRCALCNHELEHRPASEAAGEVPDRIREVQGTLTHCGRCGQWYWPGSHVDRLREWLGEALGRPVPAPTSNG